MTTFWRTTGAKTTRVLRSSLATAVDIVHVHFVEIDARVRIPPTSDRKCGQKNTVFKKFEDLREVVAGCSSFDRLGKPSVSSLL
jgi:hypothetical protein